MDFYSQGRVGMSNERSQGNEVERWKGDIVLEKELSKAFHADQ